MFGINEDGIFDYTKRKLRVALSKNELMRIDEKMERKESDRRIEMWWKIDFKSERDEHKIDYCLYQTAIRK